MKTIFLIRQLMERCREQKKYMHMNTLPFLVPTPIPETPMHLIETCSSRTYMPIEISSYKELLRDGHTTKQCVQLLSELPLNALIETYLGGVSTNNIKNQISNNQLH
jgi:hypothetical protein